MDIFGSISEATLRLSVFAGIFVFMAVLELLIPKRKPKHSRARRWFTNIAIGGIGSLLVRAMAALAIPLAAVAAAFWARDNGWGLFNATAWPAWAEITAAIVLLDLAIYGQHVISHKFPPLWRLHKVHHTDVDFDVTTAIRFHPVEIGLSMLWKIVVVVALGAAPVAVVLFEVILNGCAMFNHSNIGLPAPFDRLLRSLIVTPDMHRVHHSIYRREHDTNFGFNLSVWDRMFRTYTAQPQDGHTGMTIGLPGHQDEKPTGLAWSLALPFRAPRERASDDDQRKLSGK